MTGQVIGIYGASGFGREVLPMVREQTAHQRPVFVFIDDNATSGEKLNGHFVYNWTEFLELPAQEKSAAIAIADGRIRLLLANRCKEKGIPLFEVVAPNVIVGDEVTIGEGSILQPFVTLTSNIIIGRCFHANIYSYVAHDCQIGDFVTFAPGVMCNGNVHVGDGAYIGSGAVLRQGTPEKPLKIGVNSVVGMGAVVTKDVPNGVTVIGNPARIMEK